MTDFIYWEAQQSSQLCAMHAINTLLQAPLFTEVDLGEIGQELDREEKEAKIGVRGGNQNVSLDGYFSIQVIIRALMRHSITIDYLDQSKFRSGQYDPSFEHGLIFNRHYHWQTLRRIRGVWYDLNSLNDEPGPKVVSDFMLTSTIEAMIGDGFTVFVAKGEFVERDREDFLWNNQKWQYWIPAEIVRPYSQRQRDEDEQLRLVIEASKADAPASFPSQSYEDPELEAAIALSLVLDSVPPVEPTIETRLEVKEEPVGNPTAVELKVKFPDGVAKTRKFLPGDRMAEVAQWVQDHCSHPVSLYLLHPRRKLSLDQTLTSSGITGPVLIIAEKI